MQKGSVLFILLSSILLLFSPTQKAHADVNVKVSSNGDSSSSNVSVNSTSTTTLNGVTTTKSNGHTSIRIESNGETKTYESDENGKIIMESSDGKNSVRINAGEEEVNGDSDTSIASSESATITPSLTPKPQIKKSSPFDLGGWLRILFSSIFK